MSNKQLSKPKYEKKNGKLKLQVASVPDAEENWPCNSLYKKVKLKYENIAHLQQLSTNNIW